ncbi:receptor-like protein 12 [Gossypium australe]|uniref:Receptor-like protein 12 n=1 Tax=Gossypium australe TaxID=47621 RepID=A0A5B6UUM2_9ROSI|nr:receptor-like protein 12 [Gossypium australe]
MSSGSNLGDNLTNPIILDLDDMMETEKTKVEIPKQLEDHCKWLDEKFRAIEGANIFCGVNAKELSLVPDLVLLPKFKTPEFEKYNKTS